MGDSVREHAATTCQHIQVQVALQIQGGGCASRLCRLFCLGLARAFPGGGCSHGPRNKFTTTVM
eukprot:14600746-Alexandrium_andersonii.AAC.1